MKFVSNVVIYFSISLVLEKNLKGEVAVRNVYFSF